MPIYSEAEDGEWFEVDRREGFDLQCCDCGLVHKVSVRVAGARKKRVEIRLVRDNRATAQVRRKKTKSK